MPNVAVDFHSTKSQGGETFLRGRPLDKREDYEGGLRGPPSPKAGGLACLKISVIREGAPAQLCPFVSPRRPQAGLDRCGIPNFSWGMGISER